jgi:4-hydroxyphenylpyruvate dioxygenase
MTQPPPRAPSPLGIQRLLGLHYYVRDLERSRRFYTQLLDFSEVGGSGETVTRQGRQRSLVFTAGQIVVVCSTPEGSGGRAARYLSHHPDGVGTLAFEVHDIEHCFQELEARGGTPISDIQTYREGDGELRTFSIATPFGDTTFRFVERRRFAGLFGGMDLYPQPRGGANCFGFSSVDHVTSNFQTMSPALLWLEHVLGLERFWEVQFHTRDVARGAVHEGSGLRSRVMWDPGTGIKFANNEPYRPSFKTSQINIFHEHNNGDGVQHVALSTGNIVDAVHGLRQRGIQFMPTPDRYYDQLPARLEQLGVGAIAEDLKTLRELGILVDGEPGGGYLLQIFLKDSAGLYGSPDAGPFFYEIIQRHGDRGFGAGNFRALFESIERQQQTEGEAC